MQTRPAPLAVLLAALLAAPLLSGCFGDEAPAQRAVTPADVGHDPTAVHVSGTRLVEAAIPSWDGATTLAAVVRSPVSTSTLPDGTTPRWPVVLFLHGWGGGKESYTGGRGGVPGSDQPPGAAGTQGTDRLEAFARAGFVAVAYDARGFGESGGYADVAGTATMADLGTVLDWVEAHYPTNGRVGVVGQSYGAGQAYLAWARDPRITTAVPMYGWVDLAEGLIPNDVPKLEWAQALYAYGLAGARGRYDPMIHDWYQRIYTREGLDTVRAQMATRGAGDTLAAVQKPLLVCQGLHETLFPQADQAWGLAGGFTRAYVHAGGHGSDDEGCWDRALDWFHFFLAGFDTRVDAWPLLETVDAGGTVHPYAHLPATQPTATFLRAPDLAGDPSPDALFTVRQSASNPAGWPSALSDLLGGPQPPLPDPVRTDPSATLFTSAPFGGGETVFGTPRLRLHVQAGATPFQVSATLLRLSSDGFSQELGHGAFAALNASRIPAGDLEIRMEWTHAVLQPGDRLQLQVAANDEGWWMPLAADYSVTFDGTSRLDVPFLA